MDRESKNCLNCRFARWTEEAHGKIGACHWFMIKFTKKPKTLVKVENLNIMYSTETNVVSMFSGGNLSRIDSCDSFEIMEAKGYGD